MQNKQDNTAPVDLFIIGGGVNGCGIARDAAGRGLSVTLAEMNDLASATSSASTKLFHGGLRYLEYFEINLVRHALEEREVLLRAMPHIAWPMRFVLPYHPDMRFEGETPASKVLSVIMPWMRGRRPAWMIRFGLFLYDHLGGRDILPATKTLKLHGTPEGDPLDARFAKAFEYSDCWIEDSRLVVLNARDAQNLGAQIMPQTKVISAARVDGLWEVQTDGPSGPQTHHAHILVNAGGPWVGDIIQTKLRVNSTEGVRLVRGSHIVVPKLYEHDKCYFFQGSDGRIIFAIPYESDFTLIGTTDADHEDPSVKPVCTEEEQNYLINFANQYFEDNIKPDDVVWTYSGVRPLYDDGADSASAATRDYVLKVDDTGPPLLNIFGGKITTYRVLAEDALDEIAPYLPQLKPKWTAGAPLPGGDFAVADVDALIERLKADYSFLSAKWATRLIRAYGTDAWKVLGDAKIADDLGQDFGGTLTAAEVHYLATFEFATCAADILWRRSKLGLRLTQAQAETLETYLTEAP